MPLRLSRDALVRIGLMAALCCAACAFTGARAGPLYDAAATSQEIRFGGTVGAGVVWTPSTPQTSTEIGFAGRAALTCSGLDYGGFLKGYDAGDFLRELRNEFIGGAQAAAMNYLIVLAYSSPTIASVLDTMNHSYGAKFGSFQAACNGQEARRQGLSQGARRMAAAQDQCYENQVSSGASPTQAYQTCANEETLGSVAASLPAGKALLDFMRDHTDIELTPVVTALFGLLPDATVGAAGLQVSPPKLSLYQFNRNAEVRIGNALQQVMDGGLPAAVPECGVQSYLAQAAATGDACIPGSFAGIVQSPAFLGSRKLSPAGRSLYRDALASQIAIAATRGAILDVMTQLRKMSLRPASGGYAVDILERKAELEQQVLLLQREVDALQAFQQAKANTIRTQILAMDLAAAPVQSVASYTRPKGASGFVYDLLRGLIGD